MLQNFISSINTYFENGNSDGFSDQLFIPVMRQTGGRRFQLGCSTGRSARAGASRLMLGADFGIAAAFSAAFGLRSQQGRLHGAWHPPGGTKGDPGHLDRADRRRQVPAVMNEMKNRGAMTSKTTEPQEGNTERVAFSVHQGA